MLDKSALYNAEAGAQLLAEKEVVGSPHDRVRLIEVYRGNPLALKIVAQTIVELFGDDLVPFLERGFPPLARGSRSRFGPVSLPVRVIGSAEPEVMVLY